MIDLLKQKYAYVESLKGKNLLKFLALIFALFMIIGAVIGYFKTTTLTKNEPLAPTDQTSLPGEYATYKGTVTFIGEEAYPQDKLKYSLNDGSGKTLILLRSVDDKLSIAEGLFVTVRGKLGKTKDGKEPVLQVTEVSLTNSNGTN